ncbi:hypothetical protein KAM346_44170 [Aeromonas caviae]|nr:hypothetical protein KAM346_44170 [Aeromonas caviae]
MQAKGYSNLTAIIHMIEVLPYLAALFYGIKTFGILGVAVCWSLRMAIDFLLLFYFDKKFE